MHSYLHNIKTWNNATKHLTRVEQSVYRELTELYYDTEQPLPAVQFDRLARRVRCNSEEEKAALRYVLDEFFEKTGDVYTHDYCDQMIEEYHNMKTAKAAAGKASAAKRKAKAEARKAKRKEHTSTDDEQVLNKCSTEREQNSTNHKPLTINHKPILKDDSGEKFLMFEDWKPTKTIHDKARIFGILNFSNELTDQRIGEFKSYWITQQGASEYPKHYTADQWDHKLVKSIQKQMANPKLSNNSNSTVNKIEQLARRSAALK